MHALLSLLTAASVLHGWDARREEAWAASDPAALRSLYAAGSSAGAKDVALLRTYAARGLVVRRLVTQVFALRVLRSTPTSLRLRVFDRIAGGVVADDENVRQLGSTTPKVRVIELSRIAGVWRVVSVTERGPRAAPPLRPGR